GPSKLYGAFTHGGESHSHPKRCRQPNTVIVDLQREPFAYSEANGTGAGVGMPYDIGQSFLGNAVTCYLDSGWERWQGTRRVKGESDSASGVLSNLLV